MVSQAQHHTHRLASINSTRFTRPLAWAAIVLLAIVLAVLAMGAHPNPLEIGGPPYP